MPVVYCLHTLGLIWYVGSTKCIRKRKSDHLCGRTEEERNDWIPDMYDIEFKILEEITSDNLRQRERFYIETLKPLYNLRVPARTLGEASRVWGNKRITCECGVILTRYSLRRHRKESCRLQIESSSNSC
jgi:hypothetical protein